MKIICVLNLILIPIFMFSQKVSVDYISENRSTKSSFFDNRCEVGLTVTGDEVRKFKFIKVNMVTKALDDQGLELMGEETKENRYEEISASAATTKIILLSTSRKAKVISELSGDVSLFAPTEANGGLVKIKAFGKSVNKNLTPKIPGLSVTYLTKESVEKLNQEQKIKSEAELKKQPAEIQALAKELMNLVDAFSYMGGTGNEVSFFISGDEDKLIHAGFENASGEVIENNGWSSSGGLKTYYFNEEIKDNYTLILTVESEGAIKKIPFNLKNIELP